MAASMLPIVAVVLAMGGAGCQRDGGEPPAAPATGPVRFVTAGPGEVAALVRAAQTQAATERRALVVYVGATWCQPCVAFHAAASRGELDAALPGLTLLEFDQDRDDDRLAAAGYAARLVPLFALPGPDGRASGRQMEGARTGGDYVAELVPRLTALLAAP